MEAPASSQESTYSIHSAVEQAPKVGEVRGMEGNNWQKHQKIRFRISSSRKPTKIGTCFGLIPRGSFKPSRFFNKYLLNEKVAA